LYQLDRYATGQQHAGAFRVDLRQGYRADDFIERVMASNAGVGIIMAWVEPS